MVMNLWTLMDSVEFKACIAKTQPERAVRVRLAMFIVQWQLGWGYSTMRLGNLVEASRNWFFGHITGMTYCWATGNLKNDPRSSDPVRVAPDVWNKNGRGKSKVAPQTSVMNRVYSSIPKCTYTLGCTARETCTVPSIGEPVRRDQDECMGI
jgi:hypothetical protein